MLTQTYNYNTYNSNLSSYITLDLIYKSSYSNLKNIQIQLVFENTRNTDKDNFSDKELAELKALLSTSSITPTDEQLKNSLNDINYLVTTWLDECEKKIFQGHTLNEILHEKG